MRHANCCKISYEAGQQSRQAEVDFLNALLGIKRDQIKGFEGEIKKAWQKIDEKDKRIEAVEILLNTCKSFIQEQEFCGKPHKDSKRIEAMTNALEQALRGDHE